VCASAPSRRFVGRSLFPEVQSDSAGLLSYHAASAIVRIVSSSSSPSPLEERLDRLERALVTISSEITSIRAELQASDAQSASRPHAAPTPLAQTRSAPDGATASAAFSENSRKQSTPESKRETLDLERLTGRYGMLGIAVLAAILAVGTFLSWAYTNGYLHLSPPMRVAIGLVFAAALGTWGFQLRKRERSFGSTILALSLVIVQVCAYAAGPGFLLVPTWVAFAGTALISWLLAFFAHVENDEPLWCVGFGGAAIAPFVTSDGTGRVYALLIYGLLTLLPACFAISQRSWPVAWRVFYAASALFSLAGAELGYRATTAASLCAFAFPFVIAAAGVVPFAPEGRKRAALRWLAALGALASIRTQVYFDTRAWVVSAVLLAAAALWLFLLDNQAHLPQSSLWSRMREMPRVLNWIDVAFIPLLISYEAGDAVRNHGQPVVVYGIATLLFAAFAWRRGVNSMRDAAAFATIIAASALLGIVPLEDPLGRLVAFVGLALVVLSAHRAKPSVTWLFGGLLILFSCALASTAIILDRTAYTFPPFTTEASLTAAAVLLGLICVARFWYVLRVATRTAMGERPEWTYATNAKLMVRGVSTAPWVWAFIWATLELSMAYSASTSTLLLVTYFAATAVVCVGVGRTRNFARLRQVGLALALVATATAFYGATTYFDIAARILAYLVTSAFLLGIAYWYRRTGTPESSQATA
jgi:hypothetical protein